MQRQLTSSTIPNTPAVSASNATLLLPIAGLVVLAMALPLSTGASATTATPAKAAAKPDASQIDLEYLADLEAYRDRVEQSLRRDNGWLTLAGRFPMKEGVNSFGTGAGNDIVFPPQLAGVGAARLGTITVDGKNKTVTLQAAESTNWTAEGKAFQGERKLSASSTKRDWVALDRISMHVIERDGKYILRLADNKSEVRASFKGRIWYPPAMAFKTTAKFIPYPPGKTIPIVNVIDEVSDEPSPGYVEFTVNGKKYKLDAVGNDGGLFFVIRDGTAGDTTYRPSRFLYVEKKPEPNVPFELDFNRAYNPPCAFSEFTTCPLPPKQNILPFRVEAGEKYRKPA
jgi:uncharacterized protein